MCGNLVLWNGSRLRRAGRFVLCGAALLCCWLSPAPVWGAAESSSAGELSLRETLRQEEARARKRQESLKRLTEDEKKLDVSLAAAEESVLALEKNLEEYRARLANLASAGEGVRKDYERILTERRRTEAALRELLSTLWNLHVRRTGVSGRDLENWPGLDREYYWTAELLRAVEAYQETLREQESALAETVGRRDAIGRETSSQMAAIERRKTALLAERLKYEQRLAVLRRQRQTEESELQEVLALIESLNFDLRSSRAASSSLDRERGRLPWPVTGKIAKKFNLALLPPMNGLGISSSSGADVRAIHGGKVMHRGPMRGKGLVVLVEHGSAYYSVYAYLSDCTVSLGENVVKNQVLGRSGFYPDINNYGLHFEIWHQRAALNPEQWLEKG
ncbi:MAG: peptidoglycan DD-metalloendopeptidase family protein [Deltaproteobacteria bacterium]|jgi:septal ring factor EnvC (AmiA/AmiB activator)|nr:peptidoglycan DD-metalloendopeptidase family protein [Deltaproteobacteria bacterium]